MGVTFAKSVRFGAVRFNFSGSGIGISAGIPGLRIGTGPRGAYISGGAMGFRYRQSLGGGRTATRRASQPTSLQGSAGNSANPAYPAVPDVNVVETIRHETKNVLELRDSDSDALLKSMNEQRRKTPLWPFVGGLFLTLFLLALLNLGERVSGGMLLALAVVFAGVTLWVRWRDQMRRLTVLFYEPDAAASQLFETLSAGLRTASSAHKLKAVATTSRYGDTKYTGGATQGVNFADASLFLGKAPGVVANVDVPVLKAGRTTLALFPDRVLAFQGSAVGSVDYRSLEAASSNTQFIEHQSVPGDARVIRQTWQYVNKSGGPDRRFKNNRQLPVCAYNELVLTTRDGLDVRFMSSREDAFDALAKALTVLRRR